MDTTQRATVVVEGDTVLVNNGRLNFSVIPEKHGKHELKGVWIPEKRLDHYKDNFPFVMKFEVVE